MASPILGSFTNAERGHFDTASVFTGIFKTRKGQSVAAVVLTETTLTEQITLTIAAKAAAISALSALDAHIDRPPTELITEAFAAASRAIQQQKSLTGKSALCSMAVALVYSGKTLYIGSIGTARIYLLRRSSGLVQLTMDHTVGNLAIQRGEPPARAHQRPDAGRVGYALGMDNESVPDIGIYDLSPKAVEAEQRGREGIPVSDGDAVLVCTQTVYGVSSSGVPYVSDVEIAEVLSKSTGANTVEILVGAAIDRKPTASVAVGTMHIRGGLFPNPRVRAAVFSVILLAIIVGLMGIIFANRESALEVIRATDTSPQARITAVPTQTSTSTPTPTIAITPSIESTINLLPATVTQRISPTYTPTATVSSALIRVLSWNTDGTESTIVTRELEPITTFDQAIRAIHLDGASIFLMPNSLVNLSSISDAAITGSFAQGSDILLIAEASTPVVSLQYLDMFPPVFTIRGACLSLHMISADLLIASCYSGTCSISRDFVGQPDVTIPEGHQAIYQPATTGLSAFSPIEPSEAHHYIDLTQVDESIQACLTPYLRPDPTVTPTSTATSTSTVTRTAVPPTRTRIPNTSTPRPSATPSASSTSSATDTATRTITATSTPTVTASATMSVTPTASASVTASPTPSATETETATATPTFDAVFSTNTPIATETPTPTLYISSTPNSAISP